MSTKKKKRVAVNDPGFKIDRERLLEFSKISLAGRLQWLEETNKFIARVEGGKLMRRWLALREGRNIRSA